VEVVVGKGYMKPMKPKKAVKKAPVKKKKKSGDGEMPKK
jgi:hypothetical protein